MVCSRRSLFTNCILQKKIIIRVFFCCYMFINWFIDRTLTVNEYTTFCSWLLINNLLWKEFLTFTLCLSMCNGRKYGSNSNLSGSMSMGDCRRPFEHIFHCGFIKPQNAGPEIKHKKKTHFFLLISNYY